MLSLAHVHVYHGPIHALRGVDLSVEMGEIVTLIGANGAGKSTLLMSICGAPRAGRGRVLWDGEDITDLPSFEIIRRGIAQVPEGRRIFSRMSVLENLLVGATPLEDGQREEDLQRVFALFPTLKDRQHQRGGTLSGGEQQMLAIGRALMGRPRLLLLDEPSLGLAPRLVQRIFEIIEAINREQNVTVFLVEQNAYHALRLAHRGYVMANGRIVLAGESKALLANREVRAAYLEGGV
nr:ABC transporter ATP-binding protein [Gammaproteobacteria bacterium]